MQSQSKMSRRAAAAILVAMTMCLPAAYAAEKSFDRTLSVNGPVSLRVSTGSGYIRVSPGSDNQVHIKGRVKSNNNWGSNWWGGSSDEAVAKVAENPPIDQAGNIIRVGDDHGNDWARHVSIDYDITTPANTMLVAQSGSGDLQLSKINGTVKAQTGSGSIHADGLGAGSKLETGSGTIDANSLMGATTLQTGSGEIRAQLGSAGDVVAGTGSGDIKLENVQGAVKAETGSGTLEISGQPTAPWKLETGSGNIQLRLGNNAHFTLDAETGSGSVKSDPPLTMTTHGSIDKHHVSGTVNGGGPTIKAQTGSGDIHIM
jgi:Putative adhesin